MAPPTPSTISISCRFHSPFLHSSSPKQQPLSITIMNSNPLFSSLVALYTLILLYFPSFLNLLFSPLLLSVGILLLSLLRLGAAQNGLHSHTTETQEPPSKRCVSPPEEASFVEWDVGAPLEVIHEAEEEEGVVGCDGVMERHPSLSRFYPETDSDSDSDSSCSPERGCFRWEEEERDGLIEIKLDDTDCCGKRKVVQPAGLDFQFEEDNLIEIDISPAAGEG